MKILKNMLIKRLNIGRLYENEKDNEILNYVDVLIDGPFIQELSNKNLKYRGSENQRVLNISV